MSYDAVTKGISLFQLPGTKESSLFPIQLFGGMSFDTVTQGINLFQLPVTMSSVTVTQGIGLFQLPKEGQCQLLSPAMEWIHFDILNMNYDQLVHFDILMMNSTD